MSEYGNETATAALRLTEKGMEALLELMKYLMAREERVLKKEKIKNMKEEGKAQKISKELDGSHGYVSMKKLQKSGDDITAFGVRMNDEQIQRFSYLAKRYNIVFSSISEGREEGQKWHTVFVRNKDLSTCKIITDMMDKELVLKEELMENQKKQSDILNKGEKNLTDGDRDMLAKLRQERKEILKKNLYQTNKEESEALLNTDILSDFQSIDDIPSMGFEEALNHFTERDYAREEPYYLCERREPTSYIELNTTRDVFRDKEYSKTTYHVYKDGQPVELKTPLEGRNDTILTDERFEGRPKDYWYRLKNTMKSMGNFSNDLLMFQSIEELQRYQELFAEQQEELATIEGMEEPTEEDIQNIKDDLESQLDEIGMEIDEEGKIIDVETRQSVAELLKSNKLMLEEKAKYAEGLIISQQMELYDELAETYVGYETAKLTTLDGSDQASIINENKFAKLKEQIRKLLNKGEELKEARTTINSVQALQYVQNEYLQSEYIDNVEEQSLSVQDELQRGKMEYPTMEEWKGEVAKEKQIVSEKHQKPGLEKGLDSGSTLRERGESL